MKAVLLAGFGTLLYLAAVTVYFRLAQPQKRAVAMLTLFLATIPLYLILYSILPADLWFLPTFAVEPLWPVDLAFGLFVYLAGFFGGSLQLYNLAERGFSLRILMDIAEAPTGTMTLDDVRREYSRGRGIRWMFEKRIADMQSGEAIALRDGQVVALPRGRRAARMAAWVRNFFRLTNDV
jgi:hypothetical protein